MIRKPLRWLTLAEWHRVIDTNLTATFLLARAAEKALRQARGSIVTIASTRALMSEADTESYSASKGGIIALTHALAVSLGPDIRVNCVSPGRNEERKRLAPQGSCAAPCRPGRQAAGHCRDRVVAARP
jgi:NAD(P)-dependent dehydrogenase (short-subunit alcohol dehydrogenase family)